MLVYLVSFIYSYDGIHLQLVSSALIGEVLSFLIQFIVHYICILKGHSVVMEKTEQYEVIIPAKKYLFFL